MNRGPNVEWLTVGFITLVSLGIRLIVAAGAPFPINDGGLFYAFITDLLKNGMRLPEFSTYNGAGIPLVYPPLAFYLTGAFHLASKIPVLDLLHYVPAIVSASAVPAFFALALQMLQGSRRALLATLVFAMLPRAFDWLIMGGGITRSFGLLLFLLFLTQAVRLLVLGKRDAIVPTILLGALLILSHPEAAVHAAITAGLLVAWHRRRRADFTLALLVISATAVITSPWWLFVVTRHGLDPWLAALKAAHQDTYDPLAGLLAIFRFDFTDEPFLRIFGVFGLMGLIVQLAKREYLLFSWFILLHLVEPRGGSLFMMIPLALSAGLFLDTVLLPAIQFQALPDGHTARAKSSEQRRQTRNLASTQAPALFVAFLFLYGTVSAYFVGIRLQQDVSLTGADVAALEWVSRNTSAADRFALVTGGEPLLDATSDWFPAITGRRSVASFFGAEWIRSLDFAKGLSQYRALQACVNQQSRCLKEWVRSGVERVDYVYVRAPNQSTRTALQDSLRLDTDFQLVYSESGVELYKWVEGPVH